jgi:hypothetical protein
MLAALGILAGCAANPSHAQLARSEQEIPEVSLEEAHKSYWHPVGHVVGESCRLSNFEPMPSERAARFNLRERALAMHADAVVAIRCRVQGVFEGGCGNEGWRCDAEGIARN